MADRSTDKVCTLAHQVLGRSRYCHAKPLGRAARALENAAKAGRPWEQLGTLHMKLSQEYERFNAFARANVLEKDAGDALQ